MSEAALKHPHDDLDRLLAEAHARYRERNPESLRLYEAGREVMPGANTRTVLHYSPFPVTIARGDGAMICDVDGHEYNDFLGEYTAGLYGHNNPTIAAAIHAALDRGVTLGGPSLVEAKLARLMCDRFPAVERLRFCNSGTEANLLALSAARAFTGRSNVVVVDGSYHGGVLTFAGDSPLNVPMPFHRVVFNETDAAVDAIHRIGDTLAAVLVEPMVGAGGNIPASPEFLQGLRDASAQTGALLIFDEVMTSRLTARGLHGHYGIRPDLVSFGKYLGGGLTFGAFGGRADILDRFDPARADAWPHAGTFNNNVLTMTAGYTGLAEVYTAAVADEFFASGNRFRETFAAALAELELPVCVTGLGSMMTLHFSRETPRAPRAKSAAVEALLELVHLDMMERGEFFARRGMINLSLATRARQMERFVANFREVLAERADLVRQVVARS